jgi:hypothetical protein
LGTQEHCLVSIPFSPDLFVLTSSSLPLHFILTTEEGKMKSKQTKSLVSLSPSEIMVNAESSDDGGESPMPTETKIKSYLTE